MKILIADDILENLYLLRTLLTSQGHEVVEAENGLEALDRARDGVPDLIISDILMPGMDGFALCRHWRADPTLNRVPFMFYTATYTEAKDEEFALSLGADRFLIKPMESHDLLAEIDKVMERREIGTPAPAPRQEGDFYRQYNTRLIHKLEDKLAELESANRELSQKNEALTHSTASMQALLRSAAEAIYGIDKRGRCTFANPACIRMLGFDEEAELLNRNMDEVAHHTRDGGHPNTSGSSSVLRDQMPVHDDNTVLWRKDGSSFDAEYWAQPILEAGECTGAVVTFVDTTERRQREETERRLLTELTRASRLSTIGDLAMGLAHEINQPLCATQNYVEAALRHLRSGTDTAEVITDLEKVTGQVARAADIVKWLRRSVKQSNPELVDVDLNNCTRMIAGFLKSEIAAKGSRIILNLDDRNPSVFASETQVQQIIANLLLNSLEAADPAADFRHQITINTGIEPDDMGRFDICDNGPGISSAAQGDLFHPFVTTKLNGLGLGLSVSKTIAENLGGKIWLSEEDCPGAKFTFTLPGASASPSN